MKYSRRTLMTSAVGALGLHRLSADPEEVKETQTQMLSVCIAIVEKSDLDAKIVVKIEVISPSEILMRTSTDYDQGHGRGAIIRFKKADGEWDLKVEGYWQS